LGRAHGEVPNVCVLQRPGLVYFYFFKHNMMTYVTYSYIINSLEIQCLHEPLMEWQLREAGLYVDVSHEFASQDTSLAEPSLEE
jgi:hypothetical protein